MIINLIDLACLLVWFIQSLRYVWLNGGAENRETDEVRDEECVEEGFQLARVKIDRDRE